MGLASFWGCGKWLQTNPWVVKSEHSNVWINEVHQYIWFCVNEYTHESLNHSPTSMSCLLWSYWSRWTFWVSIWLLTCTSHLTAITFCQVSPNPMAVPKPILLHLKRRPQRTIVQKLLWIKTSFFEKPKVKVHWWWLLTQPLWDILDNYIKWKRVLWATGSENCRPKS